MANAFAGGFFVDTLQLDGIEPGDVEDNGGDVIQITGQFSAGSIEVFVVVSDPDDIRPCYSGESGSGYAGDATTPTCLEVVTPPLPKGGPYTLRAIQGVLEADLVGVLTVHNRSFSMKSLEMRQLFPHVLRVGPTNFQVLDPLA